MIHHWYTWKALLWTKCQIFVREKLYRELPHAWKRCQFVLFGRLLTGTAAGRMVSMRTARHDTRQWLISASDCRRRIQALSTDRAWRPHSVRDQHQSLLSARAGTWPSGPHGYQQLSTVNTDDLHISKNLRGLCNSVQNDTKPFYPGSSFKS